MIKEYPYVKVRIADPVGTGGARSESKRFCHMLHRFLCLLLVPLMLANQGLCFAHTHQATDFAEPEEHSCRTHFHLFSGAGYHGLHDHSHHAGHSHSHHSDPESCCPPIMGSLGDHDTDAVYCSQTVTLGGGGSTGTVVSAKLLSVATVLFIPNPGDDPSMRHIPVRGHPQSYFGRCPLYVRTLSLRI